MKKKAKWAFCVVCGLIVVSCAMNSSEDNVEPVDNSQEVTESISAELTSVADVQMVPETTQEPMQEQETLNIDFEPYIASVKEQLTNPEFFAYVKDMDIRIDEETKTVAFTAIVYDDTNVDTAVDFADTMIRRLNLEVAGSNSNVAYSTNDYYGGLYDEYNIMVGVAPVSKVDNSKDWLVFQSILKGTNQAVRANK